jgi:hypothetical protein
MYQNYLSDIGFPYYFTQYNIEQTLIIETVTNQAPIDVLIALLPIVYAQLVINNSKANCALPKGFIPRNVEIELSSNNAKYKFDISFNSSNTILWSQLLNELANPLIKSWVINGEKIPGYKLPLLLTKVP